MRGSGAKASSPALTALNAVKVTTCITEVIVDVYREREYRPDSGTFRSRGEGELELRARKCSSRREDRVRGYYPDLVAYYPI